jgi:hypothetical protein
MTTQTQRDDTTGTSSTSLVVRKYEKYLCMKSFDHSLHKMTQLRCKIDIFDRYIRQMIVHSTDAKRESHFKVTVMSVYFYKLYP